MNRHLEKNSCEILKDCYETISLYYHFLCLGIFYAGLSQRVNLSEKVPDNFYFHEFLLRVDVIKKSLEDMFNKPTDADLFSYINFANYIRGVTMAIDETLKNNEIEELFVKEFFNNDKELFNSFKEVVKFARNIFSHNIRDKIILKKEDFIPQIKRIKKKFSDGIIKFNYSYNNFPIKKIDGYKININIDYNNIDNAIYGDIISEEQIILLTDFIQNCIIFLRDKYSNYNVK